MPRLRNPVLADTALPLVSLSPVKVMERRLAKCNKACGGGESVSYGSTEEGDFI